MTIFFIVGTGRCGTQMLRNVLHSWKNVRILPETHFIIPLFNRYGTSDITIDEFLYVVDNIYSQRGEKFVYGILKHANIEPQDYMRNFRQFVEKRKISGGVRHFTEAFFEFLYGTDILIGDKTPHYGIHADIIKRFWPSAKIIHIYRDGVQVARSMTKHGGFIKLIKRNVAPKNIDEYMFGTEIAKPAEESISIDEALKYWEVSITDTLNALERFQENEHYINVRYEDILCKPKVEIARIASFLDLNLSGTEFHQAITVPRPFPEKYEISQKLPDSYEQYYRKIKLMLQKLNYPYHFPHRRGYNETLAEIYRGRFHYQKKIVDMFKHAIKTLMSLKTVK